MLNDARGFNRIMIACGRTDLRRGIDGLAAVVQEQFQLDPTEKKCPVPVLRDKDGQNQRPRL